nr:MAG TPA: hypothetical protein [Caudoviricetes sp.]
MFLYGSCKCPTETTLLSVGPLCFVYLIRFVYNKVIKLIA